MSWISMNDQLPKEDAPYLVYARTADPQASFIQIAWYEPDGFGWSLLPEAWVKAITHCCRCPNRRRRTLETFYHYPINPRGGGYHHDRRDPRHPYPN